MSKKSIVVLIILLSIELCTISASDVMISWDWKDLEYSPLYSRYQLDGTSSEGWTQINGNKTKVYFEVDTSKEHDFYIETTYDGWVWSEPSVIPIPKKTTSFSAKLELDEVDLDLLFEKNRVSIDLAPSIDKDSLNDFFTFFAKKTKIDSSQFNLTLDSNKLVLDSKEAFYQSDVRLLKMLINSIYDEWKTKRVIENVEPSSPALETEIVENGCKFLMTVKDFEVTITCEHGFTLPAFQSLSEYLVENLNLEDKNYTYKFTSNSVVFSYPELFSQMDLEEIKNTVQPVFHAWFVEYNEIDSVETVKDKPSPVEPVIKATTDLKQSIPPVLTRNYPLLKTEIALDECNFDLTFMEGNAVELKCDKDFSLSDFQSLSNYLVKNLDLNEKDFTYSFNEDSVVLTYPASYNEMNFDDILDTIKPLFHSWYIDYNKEEVENVVVVKEEETTILPVLLTREISLGDYLINVMINSEVAKFSSNMDVAPATLESLIAYMIDNFKLNPADYPYSIAGNSMTITYPSYLKKMNLEDIENQFTLALFDWYNAYTSEMTVIESEKEPTEEPPVEGPEVELLESEEFNKKVDTLEVETVKLLGNPISLSLFYAASCVGDWNLQCLDQSIGIEFSQNFFKGENRFGLGYLIGFNYDPTASLSSSGQDTYLGFKTGIDASYALGKNKNVFLSSDLGLIVSWSKTDVFNIDFTSPSFGAFIGGGLKFAINKNIMMGLKFNFNRYF